MTYPTKNVTFRTYEIDASAIERAAHKAKKSMSDYCRDVVIPWAYSDLGERRPHLPPLEQGRHASMVSRAAKAVGLTVEQFERRAAEQAAARALELMGPEDAVPGSGEHRAVGNPGSYAREMLPPERMQRRANGKR